MKPNFVRKKKRKVHGPTFWDQEYTNPTHLKLSDKESQDLAKFTRWVIRRDRGDVLARRRVCSMPGAETDEISSTSLTNLT